MITSSTGVMIEGRTILKKNTAKAMTLKKKGTMKNLSITTGKDKTKTKKRKEKMNNITPHHMQSGEDLMQR